MKTLAKVPSKASAKAPAHRPGKPAARAMAGETGRATAKGSNKGPIKARTKASPVQEQHYASVWDAIEDTPEEAESMKLRAKLMRAVQQRIQAAALPQRDAARLLGVTQPRVSDLMRGRIDLFSVEALIDMLMRLGMQVGLRIRQAA